VLNPFSLLPFASLCVDSLSRPNYNRNWKAAGPAFAGEPRLTQASAVHDEARNCTCSVPEQLDGVLHRFPAERSSLIPILQAVQEVFGYIPPETMTEVAAYLNVPETAVYGVATFYAQFYLTPQGKHRVKVCQGTACHVRGGTRIMHAVKKALGISPGETTADFQFSLERVACFGSCALAPVMVVDGKVHGRMTPQRAVGLLEGLK